MSRPSKLPILVSPGLFALVLATSCTDVEPNALPAADASLSIPDAVTPELQALEQRGHLGIEPALLDVLAAGDDEEEIELEVRVVVPRLHEADLPPMVATIEVAGGAPRYTLDGREVDESTLTARTLADRRTIDEELARQFDARRERVAAAIRDAGVEDVVQARGDTWFRVRLPRARAQALLRALDGRLTWARLPPLEIATADLRNNLHDANMDGNAYNDGEDGALESIGVINYAHGYGMRGQNVGIWHNEGYASYYKRPEFADADLRYLTSAHWQPVKNGGECRYNDECCSGSCTGPSGAKTCTGGVTCPCGTDKNGACVGDIRSQEHATLVALIAHETAPDATIYHTATTLGDCMINGSIDAQASPPVYVGAQSWSIEGGGASDNSYDVLGVCNGEFDDYIVASRIAHFHSSGNENGNYVGSPARAYNVIGVGNYEHVFDVMLAESGFLNPSTGVEKPEIVAPGTGIVAAANWARTGSSISSPMAAGFAANMMSGSAFFRNQPQAIKAYLIAGAHNVYSGPGFVGSNGSRDGAGRLDYLDTWFYRWGKVWNGNNESHFNAQNKIVETYTMYSGKRYTIAISWLANGSWAYLNSEGLPGLDEPLNMKMKLSVSRAGFPTWTSYVENNNFQLVDFTVPPGGAGLWTITIERTHNAGVGGLALALTVGEHS